MIFIETLNVDPNNQIQTSESHFVKAAMRPSFGPWVLQSLAKASEPINNVNQHEKLLTDGGK